VQLFVPAVLENSCDTDCKKQTQKTVDRKYFVATSSENAENAFQKEHFLKISLKKLA
jgi:hypothetical protein